MPPPLMPMPMLSRCFRYADYAAIFDAAFSMAIILLFRRRRSIFFFFASLMPEPLSPPYAAATPLTPRC